MIRSSLAALCLISLAVAPAVAEEDMIEAKEMIGPVVGEVAPDFSLITSDGEAATLESLSGENGVALSFVRSLDWCPFCKKQAIDLEAAKAPLEDAGWNLVVLSYDPVETLSAFADDKALTYTLASDPGSETIKAFNLLNKDGREGTRYEGIPHPAIVFVSVDGTVASILREEGFKERPQVEVVIETATDLSEASSS